MTNDPIVPESAHQHAPAVICPWCGADALAGWQPLWDNPFVRCGVCYRPMVVRVEVEPVRYTTERVMEPT